MIPHVLTHHSTLLVGHVQPFTAAVALVHFRAPPIAAAMVRRDAIGHVLADGQGGWCCSWALKVWRVEHFELLWGSDSLQRTVVTHMRGPTLLDHRPISLCFQIHRVVRRYPDVLLGFGRALNWGWINIVVCFYLDATILKINIWFSDLPIIGVGFHVWGFISTAGDLLPVTPMLFRPLLRRPQLAIVSLGCLLFQITYLLFQEEVLRLRSHL